MKALILIGGFGTRLYPLTFSKSKPLVEFCNLPILEHQVKALSELKTEKGENLVSEIVLATSGVVNDPDNILSLLSSKYGITIVQNKEDEPLGTAGPLLLAEERLRGDAPFFVFNADVSSEYPLRELLDFYVKNGGLGTLVTTRVTDPTKYGVVLHDSGTGRISSFLEKPTLAHLADLKTASPGLTTDEINAGIYCLSPTVLDMIKEARIRVAPAKKVMLEKEIFPRMAQAGSLFALPLKESNYWMDIGQPKDFLAGQRLHLAATRGGQHASSSSSSSSSSATSSNSSASASAAAAASGGPVIHGDVSIHPTAVVDPTARLGPNVVIGADCTVGKDAVIEHATILPGTSVGEGAHINQAIVGWKNAISANVHITGKEGAPFVSGEDVTIKAGVRVANIRICPHLNVSVNKEVEGEIIM